MTDSFTSEPPEDSGPAASVGPTNIKSGARRAPTLYVVGSAGPRQRKKKVMPASSHVMIAVNADGYIEVDSEFAPKDADRMVDALLVMLVKARRAAS
jgi:hypothetical protein